MTKWKICNNYYFVCSEYWSVQSFKGTNLKQTIVHELGHSLGLSHSDKREAVMAPFYRGWDPHLKLSRDDRYHDCCLGVSFD